jgi:glucuronate isomerase
LPPDRLLPADPGTRAIAREILAGISDLPLVAVHGHVDAAVLAADRPFRDPAALFVTADHYVLRVLHSVGVPLGELVPDPGGPDRDPREVWRHLCRRWDAFRGTSSRLWLEHELVELFGVPLPLDAATADESYDLVAGLLVEPGFRPRALFERFGLEILSTTDPPGSSFEAHDQLQSAGLAVVPTLRPDPLTDPTGDGWGDAVEAFGADSYRQLLAGLRAARLTSAGHGAVATDHGHFLPATEDLGDVEASTLFDRLRKGDAAGQDAARLGAHLLTQMAVMSVEDGLVMQLHTGVLRNHDRPGAARHGADKGADFPVPVSFTAALRPLLERCGNLPGFRLVVFTVDETAFSRELAPMASYYPGLYLGAPWWFLDAPDAMGRHFAATVESAGYAKLTGFVDDTRAFCSIPARHDVARRSISAHLARMVAEHRLSLADAHTVARDYAYDQPRAVYLRGGGSGGGGVGGGGVGGGVAGRAGR